MKVWDFLFLLLADCVHVVAKLMNQHGYALNFGFESPTKQWLDFFKPEKFFELIRGMVAFKDLFVYCQMYGVGCPLFLLDKTKRNVRICCEKKLFGIERCGYKSDFGFRFPVKYWLDFGKPKKFFN